jgi:hypothetical protein
MGQELPPPDAYEPNGRKPTAYKEATVRNLVERIRHLERELAAAYEDGKAVQRKEDERVITLRDDRIRELERVLAERKPASIDTPEFRKLMGDWSGAAQSCDLYTRTEGARKAWAALIAYINGRSAGTAPEDLREAMARLCEDMAIHWQQDEGTYAAGKKAGALDCAEAIRAAAPTPTNSGREEAK